MPCRVGITTRLEKRRNEWEREVVKLKNRRIPGKFPTREEAQAFEDRYALERGCQAAPGGSDAPGPWYVYYFEYTRERS